jgi:hypothetical protein
MDAISKNDTDVQKSPAGVFANLTEINDCIVRCRHFAKLTVEGMLGLGEQLIILKKYVDRGQFQSYIEHEIKISYNLAQKAMKVFEKFGDKKYDISELPRRLIVSLSADTTSDAIVEKTMSLVSNGTVPKAEDVQTWKKEEQSEITPDPLPPSEPEQPIIDMQPAECGIKSRTSDISLYLDTNILELLEDLEEMSLTVQEKKNLKALGNKLGKYFSLLKKIYDPGSVRPSVTNRNEMISEEDAVILVEELFESISEHTTNVKLPTAAAVKYHDSVKDMQKLARIYQEDCETISKRIAWIRKHDEGKFKWGPNIQSVRKLHEKYGKISTKMDQGSDGTGERSMLILPPDFKEDEDGN